jgi:pimeloyl-ACP methyl ester carboxylesterase
MKINIIFFLIFCIPLTGKAQQIKTMEDLNYEIPVSKVRLDNGIEIVYADQGKGKETILFIHGLASYIPAWKKNLEVLKEHYRCIAIDLPGYGKSSKGNYEVSMEFFAKTVAEICQKLNIDKVVLAGHSMGGQIAITTALQYPDLVSKLILIAPAGFETFSKGEKQWFRDVMTVDGVRLTTVEQIRVNYAYNFYNMPDDAAFMVDDRIWMRTTKDFTDYCYHITQGVNAMVDQPVFDFLPMVKQPTLCIFGENDNLIPNRYLNGGPTKKYAQQGAAQMPDVNLKMIKKAGHFVMFEKSGEVNKYIQEFLK